MGIKDWFVDSVIVEQGSVVETGSFQIHQVTYCINNYYWISNNHKVFEGCVNIFFLAIVSAVRESDLDHNNYARHNNYQHVNQNIFWEGKKVLQKIW